MYSWLKPSYHASESTFQSGTDGLRHVKKSRSGPRSMRDPFPNHLNGQEWDRRWSIDETFNHENAPCAQARFQDQFHIKGATYSSFLPNVFYRPSADYENARLFEAVADLVAAGIRRHASFEARRHCVLYPAEASSDSRRLYAQQWRTNLLNTIQDRQIDCNVVDKYMCMHGELNFVYDPMANILNNVLGRQALDAMAPVVSMRTHAAHHGLPGIPGQLLDAFSNGGVLPHGVRGTMHERVQNFEGEIRRG